MRNRVKKSLSILLLVVILMMTLATIAYAGTFISKTYNGKAYKVFVPTGYQSGVATPLVVMLHGCTQDPDQFATGTRMNVVAERENFIVVYPDQPSSANQNKCWNWFETAHQSRGTGEPAHIVGIVNAVKGSYTIDNNKVYVAGLSGGAAMSVIMGATYPDVFAGIGVASGLEYKAATTMNAAWTAMSSGGPDPQTQGNAAYTAMGSYAKTVPTIVFHGTSDYTVSTTNGNQVISQWAQTNDKASDGSDNNNIDDTADETVQGQVPGGRSYTRYIYKDNRGSSIMEKYLVDSMGHAWSGGDTAGSYTDPKGPDASTLMWEFFKAHPRGGTDTTAPVTTANPGTGTYSGSVTVTLSVNETATTYYTTNGSTPTTASAQYAGPITITGTATLKYFSVDPSGNTETVKSQTYTITGDLTAPVTTASPTGGTYNGSVTVTLTANESAVTYYTLDGSGPTTNSPQYTSAITLTESTTLKFFSKDSAGNVENVKTENYNITQNANTSFVSFAAEDGFVGVFASDGMSTTVHKLGDKGFYNGDTYRTILSFDTSTLPDNAVIESVTLRVYRKSLSGTVNSISIDVKNGHFGTSSSLEQEDFNNAASSTGVATLTVPAANNGYSEVVLPAGIFDLINKTGKTQFRLKAATAADYASDLLEIYGGEGGSYAPVLYIVYGESADTTAPVTTAQPAGGTYSSSVNVTLTANETATIYYTMDGSTPTTSSTKYTNAITLTQNTTLKFFSVDVAGNQEAVKSETYTITAVSDTTAPVTTATPVGGTFNAPVIVELAPNEPATIYYTTNGTTPTTSSAQYSAPLTIQATTTLKYFAEDVAGNQEAVQSQTYEIITSTEVSFRSSATLDGYVGQYAADGMSTTVHKIGDKGMYNGDTFRVILSFDTSSLPDQATITGAKLRIYRKSLSGTMNSVKLDIVKGYFGTTSALEQGDYSAAVSSSAAVGTADIAILSVPAANNAYTEIVLPTSVLEFINVGGLTQFRLKGTAAADFTSDLLEIFGGDHATYAPVLFVTY